MDIFYNFKFFTKVQKFFWVIVLGGPAEWVCLRKTQLLRIIYTFYSKANSTSLWCPLGNANWGYGNLVSIWYQKKISTSLLVVIILVHYKWHMWTVHMWDGISGENTQFPGLPTGLSQEGHLAVRQIQSLLFCY